MVMNELLPCPHCGYTAKIRVTGKRKKELFSVSDTTNATVIAREYYVRCECCVCHSRTRAIPVGYTFLDPLECVKPGGFYKYGTLKCFDDAADAAIEIWNKRDWSAPYES